MSFENRLALHTWTLDTTPLAEVLRIARDTGWNAIELRRVDFKRAFDAGLSNEQVLDLVRASGLAVACVGVEYGWIHAQGDERKRLFKVMDETCANAVALGCKLIMSAPGPNAGGTPRAAAASLKEAGDIAQAHGVKLALEFSSRHDLINSLEAAREIIALAAHPHCGLLLDAYHMTRLGWDQRAVEDVPAHEIFAFQFSDVPPTPLPAEGPPPIDRLLPGQGVVRWAEVLALLEEKHYSGYLSYEAPNPLTWARPPADVAREAVDATRALLAAHTPKMSQ